MAVDCVASIRGDFNRKRRTLNAFHLQLNCGSQTGLEKAQIPTDTQKSGRGLGFRFKYRYGYSEGARLAVSWRHVSPEKFENVAEVAGTDAVCKNLADYQF